MSLYRPYPMVFRCWFGKKKSTSAGVTFVKNTYEKTYNRLTTPECRCPDQVSMYGFFTEDYGLWKGRNAAGTSPKWYVNAGYKGYKALGGNGYCVQWQYNAAKNQMKCYPTSSTAEYQTCTKATVSSLDRDGTGKAGIIGFKRIKCNAKCKKKNEEGCSKCQVYKASRCFVCDTKQFHEPGGYSVDATVAEKQSFLACAIKLLERYGTELPKANECVDTPGTGRRRRFTAAAMHLQESARAIMAL